MEYRLIKNFDMNLSVIGTGCWSFGGGDYWGPLDQKDATDVVHVSVANGINYFDTAEIYNEGRSESSLGFAMKGIPRDKLIIGTKVSPCNAYSGILEEHCEASLRRLQTDYIDIYMLHWPLHSHALRHFTKDEKIIKNPPTHQEAFASLLKLQKEGKIRHIGLSNFGIRRLKEDVPENVQVVVNELPYNLLCRAIEYDTLPYCIENGIGTIGYITLMQGILTGKYASLQAIPEMLRRTRHFNYQGTPLCRHGEPGFEKETAEALKNIEKIAGKYGIKMAELATRWAIDSGITCTLTGAKNSRQLEENVRAIEVSLNTEIIQELNDATRELKEKLGNNFDYYENKKDDRTC
jgi:myo-inositol catabolism protein IolS